MVQLVNQTLVLILYFIVVFPLLGGAMLWKGFELAKVPGFTFTRCWKVYLAGLLWCYLAIWGVSWILLQPSGMQGGAEPNYAPIVRTVLIYAIPMMAIPLVARNFSPRAIAVELLVILLANTLMILLFYTTLPYVLGTQPQADQVVPADSITPRQPASRR
jgi:hypothetical protein